MSLQFNISQLLKSEVGDARRYDVGPDGPIDLDDMAATHVRGQVKFMLTNLGVVAKGSATACLHLTCARCLDEFDNSVEVSFTEEYRPTIDIGTGMPVPESQSETAFDISDHHTIDLTEALRQHLLLAVDLIPVCRNECRGLCPTCGANLNAETCNCPPVEESSPFASLQGLLTDHVSNK